MSCVICEKSENLIFLRDGSSVHKKCIEYDVKPEIQNLREEVGVETSRLSRIKPNFTFWESIFGNRVKEKQAEIEAAQRESLVYPGRLLYLKDHTFRAKNPAIVGMRVVGGRIHIGQKLMKLDGTPVGQVKSLRTRSSEDVKEANQGDEVAVAIQGPTVGRHIEELDEFYVDVPASHAKRLKKLKLDPIEQEILDELIRLHRKEDHFWGR